jgi:hypothetical protein
MEIKIPHHHAFQARSPSPAKPGRYNFLVPPQLVGEGDRTNAQREMWWWGVLLSCTGLAA